MFISLSILILLLPFLGFIVLILSGKKLPRNGDWLGTGLMTSAFLLSLFMLVAKISWHPEETLASTYQWVLMGGIGLVEPMAIEIGIMVDNLTVIMLVVVTLVSTLVHFFSIGYMKGDIRYSRYFAMLGLFSFSMIGIVLTHNLLMMYIFWELVGISSYLLIGHWYEKKSATNAASKAFIVNRIGDAGMFIGIMILFANYSTFTFESIFDSIAAGVLPFGSSGWLTAAGILIFCGAVGKSAQFPLHVWLPDAMEGPTPVSALIHAATMVAAGVYLVARIFPMLTADALLIIAYVGAITALIAATIAVTQFDIKKVLAYSTISQLGYMIMGLGVGAFSAGFMHLVTHAAFKAGLFLGAGSVIYAMHNALHKRDDHHTDAQDIRNMGGLKSRMPVTYWTFLVFTLAISGIPLTSGFLSKDEILAGALGFSVLNGHVLLPVIGFVVAGLTAFYMFRVLILTFQGEHSEPSRLAEVKESPKLMTIPLLVLASLSLFVFYSFDPFGASSGWFYSAVVRPITVVPEMVRPAGASLLYEAVHGVHGTAMILSISFAAGGVLFALAAYQWKKVSPDKMARLMGALYRGSLNKWYFDEAYNKVFLAGALRISHGLRWFDAHVIDAAVNGTAVVTRKLSTVHRWFDEKVVDGLVNLTARGVGMAGNLFGQVQTGRVQTYLTYVIVSFLMLALLFMGL